jgi:hypothetical protein
MSDTETKTTDSKTVANAAAAEDATLESLYKALTKNGDDNKNNWLSVLVEKKGSKYNLNAQNVQTTGIAGIQSDVANRAKNTVFYVLKVLGVDKKESVTSTRSKYVLIRWIGSGVPPIQKMGGLAMSEQVNDTCNGIAVTMDATSADDVDTKRIGSELLRCGGAHKPTEYDFGAGVTLALSELSSL